MRSIGLHIRIPHSLLEAAHYADKLNVPIFQIFLIDQIARRPLTITTDIITEFKNTIGTRVPFIHGSYFINLAHLQQSGRKTLEREMKQAQEIGAPYLILHPGSATGQQTHQKGLEQLARILNPIIKHETNIQLLLENTAHGGKSVGSNINDFARLKDMLDHPERLAFCIDTAHAHTYGYDLSTVKQQNEFISLIEKTIGTESIALIHLNDSHYDAGSRIDKHASIGKGTIGDDALRSFILHPSLASIPVIMELPILPFEKERAILQKVIDWHL